jgi:hypothetical protein
MDRQQFTKVGVRKGFQQRSKARSGVYVLMARHQFEACSLGGGGDLAGGRGEYEQNEI